RSRGGGAPGPRHGRSGSGRDGPDLGRGQRDRDRARVSREDLSGFRAAQRRDVLSRHRHRAGNRAPGGGPDGRARRRRVLGGQGEPVLGGSAEGGDGGSVAAVVRIGGFEESMTWVGAEKDVVGGSEARPRGGLLLIEDNQADILFFKRALSRARPDV